MSAALHLYITCTSKIAACLWPQSTWLKSDSWTDTGGKSQTSLLSFQVLINSLLQLLWEWWRLKGLYYYSCSDTRAVSSRIKPPWRWSFFFHTTAWYVVFHSSTKALRGLTTRLAKCPVHGIEHDEVIVCVINLKVEQEITWACRSRLKALKRRSTAHFC